MGVTVSRRYFDSGLVERRPALLQTRLGEPAAEPPLLDEEAAVETQRCMSALMARTLP